MKNPLRSSVAHATHLGLLMSVSRLCRDSAYMSWYFGIEELRLNVDACDDACAKTLSAIKHNFHRRSINGILQYLSNLGMGQTGILD